MKFKLKETNKEVELDLNESKELYFQLSVYLGSLHIPYETCCISPFEIEVEDA